MAESESRPSLAAHEKLQAEAERLRLQLSTVGHGIAAAGGGAGANASAAGAAELLAAAGLSTTAGAAGEEADGSGLSMNALLVANGHRLQAELALARTQLADLEGELRASRDTERRLSEQNAQQASAIDQLEGRLLQARSKPTAVEAKASSSLLTTPSALAASTGSAATLSAVLHGYTATTTPAAPVTPSSLPSSGVTYARGAPHTADTPTSITNTDADADDAAAAAAAGGGGEGLADDALRLVCGQRERARRQAEELEAENRRLKDQSKATQAEGRRLQADNLRLYEKVKYLQSTARAAGAPPGGLVGSNSIEEERTEGRYEKMYEEKVNPFAAFHRRERQQRYAELAPPEKLILKVSHFLLASGRGGRHARLFLVGYLVCLHLLVSGAMYVASHHC